MLYYQRIHAILHAIHMTITEYSRQYLKGRCSKIDILNRKSDSAVFSCEPTKLTFLDGSERERSPTKQDSQVLL